MSTTTTTTTTTTTMQPAIRGVLIDVSGTVHVGDQVIPGAASALDRLRASGIPVTARALSLSLPTYIYRITRMSVLGRI